MTGWVMLGIVGGAAMFISGALLFLVAVHSIAQDVRRYRRQQRRPGYIYERVPRTDRW